VIDITDPLNPQIIGICDTPGSARAIALSGNAAFVADYSFEFQVIDISDPNNPQPIGARAVSGHPMGIAISGNLAYFSMSYQGVCVVDISDPQNPQVLSVCTVAGDSRQISVKDNYVYTASREAGVNIIDVSDPTAPVFVSNILPHPINDVSKCYVNEDNLYVIDQEWNEIRIYDLEDPRVPNLACVFPWYHGICDVSLVGNQLFAASSEFGLSVFDLSFLVPVDEQVSSPIVPAIVNYPNPFNPETSITYSLPENGMADLRIYNLRGQCVRKLIHSEQTAGEHRMTWDGRDDQGHSMASGVYMCRIEANGDTQTHRMMLLK
jgi:hypothetical protein